MKSLAFIDHSFHKASRSSDFFTEILRQEYNVTMFFDETSRGGPEADIHAINAGNFDVVVFWQSLPAPFSLLRLSCTNLIWVPMFDSEWNRADLAWRALRAINVKVICFSKAIFEATRKNGVSSQYVQYFPEIPPQTVQYDAPRLYFWQRTNFLTWASIRQVLSGNGVEKTILPAKTILKDDPDPGHVFAEPSHHDVGRFHIEIVRNMKIASGGRREDYLRMLSGCNIFVAPRLREGIGLAFLEAMAMGMCVVGADLPTLNEYVETGQNGYLFDFEHIAPVDISGFAQCGIRARELATEGRKKWLEGIPSLMQFMAWTPGSKRSGFATAMVLLWGVASAAKRHYEQMFGRSTG